MWDNAFPSFLIGLREGLEAGLIVSVLVATLVRAGRKERLPQVWTGVLAAIALSLSFGAVLTFTAAELSGPAQEAFGGFLSLIAVVFVTAMVFWMRNNARSFSGDIKEKVTAALGMGAGMLVFTAFLAVAREGLETALFLWTAAQGAGSSGGAGPMTGAAAGIVLAALLCWGLYRRALKINLTKFFTVTGAVLIVIASGVLGYGLRDLQDGGILPGGAAFAIDLSGHVNGDSWYVALLQGTLNWMPQMTWLQVAAYVAYLAVVMTLFLRGAKARVKASAKPKPAEPTPEKEPEPKPAPEQQKARRVPRWVLPVAVVLVPALIAGAVVATSSGKPTADAQTVAVSPTECGKGFTAPKPGRQTFQVRNTGKRTAEIYLLNPVTNAVYGEVEGIAPGTTRSLVATIGGGQYAWRCVPNGGKAVTSAAVRVSGGGGVTSVVPVNAQDLAGPLKAYRAYVDRGLAGLAGKTRKLSADLDAGDLPKARKDWTAAHTAYASLGAAYGTFEDYDKRIDGRADGLPKGVHDKDFTGFFRLEHGLWHGQKADELKPYADRLTTDVVGLRKAFPHQDFDVADLPLRTHEILENTLQRELTGESDYGSGTGLDTARANLRGTQELLDVLTPLIEKRDPKLLPAVNAWMKRTEDLADAHRGTAVDDLSPADHRRLDGTLSRLLEELAPIPDLLEVRKAA